MTDASEIRLGVESVKAFFGNATGAAVGFIGTVVFSRLFAPGQFGGFYLLYSLVFLADRPVRGFITAARKRFSEANTDGPRIVGTALVVLVVGTVAVTLATFPLWGFLESWTRVSGAGLVFITMFAASNGFLLFQGLVGAAGQAGRQVWLDAGQTGLGFACQLVLVVAGLGTAGMGYGLAAAWLLATPVALASVRVWPARPDIETARSLWSYARYSTFVSAVGKAYDRFDVILLGVLATTAAVGHYEVAAKLTIPAMFASGAVGTALMPLISNRHSRGEPIARQVADAAGYSSIVAVPLAFGAVAIGERLIITVYGSAYAPAGQLIAGLALYRLLKTQSEPYQQTLAGIDRPDVRLRVNAATLALNVVIGVGLVIALPPAKAAVGVVAATVVAESVRLVLSVTRVRREVDIPWLPRSLLHQLIAGALMFAVVQVVAPLVPAGGLPGLDPDLGVGLDIGAAIGLGFVLTVGATVYAVVLLVVSATTRRTVVAVARDFSAW